MVEPRLCWCQWVLESSTGSLHYLHSSRCMCPFKHIILSRPELIVPDTSSDTYGRRPLLLTTYPFLSLTMLWTGLSFLIPSEQKLTRTAMITTGMYLFECFYSPGMGPVPFSYSAESFPIQVRDVGMAFATATTWCFNFILSLTWPLVVKAFTNAGGFGWWAAWNVILWFLTLLFMPETKGELTTEKLRVLTAT